MLTLAFYGLDEEPDVYRNAIEIDQRSGKRLSRGEGS